MKKVTVKMNKKKVCSMLAVGLMVCSIHVSASGTQVFAQQGKASDIKVLKNQQEEINEVLSIKDITTLSNINDKLWIDDKRLLCIESIYNVENTSRVENLLVYNADTKETTRITDNKEMYAGRYYIAGMHKLGNKDMSYSNNKYIVYTESSYPKASLYSLNTKDFSITKIDEKNEDGKISRVSNDKVAYVKNKKIIMVDLCTGEKKEIKLPKDLYHKLISAPCTYDEFLELEYIAYGRAKNDEYSKNRYDRNVNEFLADIDLKDDKLLLRDTSCEGYGYILDLKTNTYIDSYYFPDDKPKRVETGSMTISGVKLRELNEKGEQTSLIDEGMIDLITPSPDGSKLFYRTQGNSISTYIYDFNTGKRVPLYLKTNSQAFWNETSNRIALRDYNSEIGGFSGTDTLNVITIN